MVIFICILINLIGPILRLNVKMRKVYHGHLATFASHVPKLTENETHNKKPAGLSGRSLTRDDCAQKLNVPYGTGIVAITPGTAVSIQPTNTGGAVPGNQWFQISTFAGSNAGPAVIAGYVNGIGASALFNRRGIIFERQARPTASG